MATVNNGEFTISHVSMEKVLDGNRKPCGSAIFFPLRPLLPKIGFF